MIIRIDMPELPFEFGYSGEFRTPKPEEYYLSSDGIVARNSGGIISTIHPILVKRTRVTP